MFVLQSRDGDSFSAAFLMYDRALALYRQNEAGKAGGTYRATRVFGWLSAGIQ